ncbi:hypothetical protein O988_08643 [Pseudogymnoascus sp. VKM F-3808]|nr:hypothetical protein O988_08643 [Pseudogymnoascus sp. VKM F-3808]
MPALHRHADSHPLQPYRHHSPTHVDPPPSLFSWRDRTETTASLFLGDGRDADAAHLYLGDIQSITSVCQLSIGGEAYSVGREAATLYLGETGSFTTPHSLTVTTSSHPKTHNRHTPLSTDRHSRPSRSPDHHLPCVNDSFAAWRHPTPDTSIFLHPRTIRTIAPPTNTIDNPLSSSTNR